MGIVAAAIPHALAGQATARCAPVLHVGLDAGVVELAADQALGIIHGVARVQSRLQFRSCIKAEMYGFIKSAVSSHLYDLEEVAEAGHST